MRCSTFVEAKEDGMASKQFALVGVALAVGLIGAGQAFGVGPWPGLAATVAAPTGDLRYTAPRANGFTTVKAIRRGHGVVASATFKGSYGIPAVTSNGRSGGLSPDGRLLVLSEPPNFQHLRLQSHFLVISTKKLQLAKGIVLDGEFGFDAISPDRRTLYLIQHGSEEDLVRYVVRAYDLRANRLLPQPIVDKREADETMKGYPVSRATSGRGAWVYTLYQRQSGKPFIHALNTLGRAAVCIDLPWSGSTDRVWNAHLELSRNGKQLVVRLGSGGAVATVDVKTLRVL
jgi:hypothetical protein